MNLCKRVSDPQGAILFDLVSPLYETPATGLHDLHVQLLFVLLLSSVDMLTRNEYLACACTQVRRTKISHNQRKTGHDEKHYYNGHMNNFIAKEVLNKIHRHFGHHIIIPRLYPVIIMCAHLAKTYVMVKNNLILEYLYFVNRSDPIR